MDRNQAIGMVLMAVLLFVYFYFMAPPAEEANTPEPITQTQQDPEPTTNQSNTTPLETEQSIPDSINEKVLYQKYGVFSSVAKGEEKLITIENEDAIFTFSTLGGNLQRVELKEFKTYDGEPLVLLDKDHSKIEWKGQSPAGFINFSELYFKSNSQDRKVSNTDSYDLSFILETSTGGSITFLYTIPGNGYNLETDVIFNGLQTQLDNEFSVEWSNHQKKFEKDINDVRQKSTVKWCLTDLDVDELKERSTDKENKEVDDGILWASSKQKFFNSSLIAREGAFTSGSFSTDVDEKDQYIVKNTKLQLKIEAENVVNDTLHLAYFVGPNNYKMLKKIAPEFEQIVYLGYPLVSWVNKLLIINVFNWLETFIDNYGLIILILVVIIKLILSPLSYTSYKSMAKTKVLKPEIDAIKEKHGDDMQKVQAEQMQLYQKVGVNPLSGCIPLVLQMPILLAMFFFFPNSIELRQEAFLWADDLSTYDVILNLPFTIPAYGSHVSLFTLLMTASTLLITWSNQQVSTVQGPMKSLSYMMPIVFMFVLNSLPAALSFYYFVSNLVTYGQQELIKRFIDEDKIKKVLEENRKKNVNKKKSSFQQRLEDAMKASEQQKKKKK